MGDLSWRLASAQTLRLVVGPRASRRLAPTPAEAIQVNAILLRSREAMASRLRSGIVRFARNTWRVELSEFGVS